MISVADTTEGELYVSSCSGCHEAWDYGGGVPDARGFGMGHGALVRALRSISGTNDHPGSGWPCQRTVRTGERPFGRDGLTVSESN